VLANYAKPAPAFVKQKFTAGADGDETALVG
jgi:hypothetical protein